MLIDTELAKRKLLASFSEEEAATVIDVLRMFEAGHLANLATKDDLGVLEERLTRRIYAVALSTALAALGIGLGGVWALLEFYL